MFKDTQKITEVYDQKILPTFKKTKLNLFSTTIILQNCIILIKKFPFHAF